MNQQHSQRKHGFTLVEIAVVLVIIGLLIGGILFGLDLVKAAQERAAISQIQEFNVAVWRFRNQYNGLPGDAKLTNFPQFATRSGLPSNGDGDGAIEHFSYGFQCGEVVAFWSDLHKAGLISGASDVLTTFQTSNSCYSATLDPDSTLANYFPKSKFKDTYVFLYSGSRDGTPNSLNITQLGHAYILARSYIGSTYGHYNSTNNNGNVTEDQATIPALSAYNLDNKIDDGLPRTGKVLSADLSAYGVLNSQTGTNNCYTGTEYNKQQANIQELCELAIKSDF